MRPGCARDERRRSPVDLPTTLLLRSAVSLGESLVLFCDPAPLEVFIRVAVERLSGGHQLHVGLADHRGDVRLRPRCPLDPRSKVRVSKSDGSVMPASKSSGDPFGHAVSLLAGNAFMRSLGRPDDGDSTDFVRASFLVAMQFDDRTEAAKEAFSIVCEATSALVRTPRFIDLATALAPKLAKGYLHLGSEVERFLREPGGSQGADGAPQGSFG